MTETDGTAADTDARRKLADELQRLRVRSGKSLRELAVCTHSSDSSLSRYLTGQVVPPWRTVETLCGVAGEDPGPMKALWTEARSVRILDKLRSQGPGHRPAGEPSPPPRRSRRRSVRIAAAVIGVVALMAATGIVVHQWTVRSMEDRFARERTAAASPEPLQIPASPRCQFSHSRVGKAQWLDAFLVDPGGTLKRGEVCHIGRAYVTVDEEHGLTVRMAGRRDVEWQSSWFSRKGARTDRAVFTADGRLSTYDAAATELWASHRPARAVKGHLAIQSDGNLVIYSTDGQHLWAIR